MKINRTHSFVIIATCLLFLISIVLYAKHYLILGGEGNFFTNFTLIKSLGSFTWVSLNAGTGASNPTLNGLVVVFDFFSLLEKMGASLKIVNTMLALLVYTLPFLSMIWMLYKVVKVNFVVSYLLSLFYVLNPFSTYHLQGLMFWNTAPLFVLPIIFGCIYRYYFEKFKLFLIFGLLSALFAFSFANIPYLGVFQIFLIISIIIIPYLRNTGFTIKTAFINIVIIEVSFILFNAWWFINLIRFQMQDLKSYYTSEFAIGWAISAAGSSGVMGRILSLKTLVMNERNTYFSDFYNNFPVNIILFIPFFLIVWNLFKECGTQKNKQTAGTMIVASFILIVWFLNKGVNEPFTGIYLWMLNHIPFFIIFKSPLEKFSVLLVFLFTIGLIQVFRNAQPAWTRYLLIVYVIACSIPYFTLNLFPEYKVEPDGKYISKQYLDKKGYFEARQLLNNSKLDYRVLSLPGSNNYQVTVLNHDGNRYYRGMDPFLYSINKPFIAAYTAPTGNIDHIFTNLSNTQIRDRLLNIYNVGRIVIDKDIYPSFGFREKQTVNKLIELFSTQNEGRRFNPIHLFTRNDFLPHIYTTKMTTITDEEPNSIIKWATASAEIRTATYFTPQNKGKDLNKFQMKGSNNQILEFKKINPTKYRVNIHNASGAFPLIFSESFHLGWKIYIQPTVPQTFTNYDLKDYQILYGNDVEQASQDELRQFITQGVITTLGDRREKQIILKKWVRDREEYDFTKKYTIDFISKNFQGTIQNDNLPNGTDRETWFKTPIVDEGKHAVANGYANSWMLDTDTICKTQGRAVCIKNTNGTYDFELVIEFWPQRIFYSSLLISVVTLALSLIYMLGSFAMRKKGREN